MKNLTESFATLKLKKIIESEKERLTHQKSDYAKMKVQEQIIDLQNEILPIIETETVLLYNEMAKYVNKKVSEAVKQDANLLVMLIPLTDSKDNTLKIATVNPHQDNPLEGVEIDVYTQGRQIKEVKL